MYTDDIDVYTARKEKELYAQKECELCGEYIQDDDWIKIPKFGYVCIHCQRELRGKD